MYRNASRRLLRRALIVTATVATVTIASAVPAQAATGSTDVGGSHVTAAWTWNGTYSANNILLGVKDTSCDGHTPYGHIRLVDNAGSVFDGPTHRNNGGCGITRGWDDGSLRPASGRPLVYVRIIACNDDFGSDTCDYTSYRNPNY